VIHAWAPCVYIGLLQKNERYISTLITFLNQSQDNPVVFFCKSASAGDVMEILRNTWVSISP